MGGREEAGYSCSFWVFLKGVAYFLFYFISQLEGAGYSLFSLSFFLLFLTGGVG